jgi:hypothetical protein
MCPEITKSKESTTTVASPKAKKDRKSKVAPKSKDKPKTKAAAEHGTERANDLPWCAKKVAIFKALKALKAFGSTSAAGTQAVAEKANVSARDVRHYCYHAKASGLVGIAEVEDIRGYGFYLTAKGQKVDPAAELKAKQQAKAE